jgi:iron complex outermembrane receptor protein
VTFTNRYERLTSIAGVFLFEEHDDQDIRVSQIPAAAQTVLTPRVEAGSAAFFVQATLAVTSRLSATMGARHTRERKTIDNAGGRVLLADPSEILPGTAYAYSDAIHHDAWTPRLAVDVKLPGQATAYASATRGFKSGGFNPSSAQAGRGFGPEWAWNYEGGLKTDLLAGRARLNVAAFHMDYTNLQVQTPIAVGVFDIRNAAAATIRGVELEGAARLAGGLEVGGHLTRLDATYDQFIAVGIGGVTGDVAGHRLNNAPAWAGRLWGEWSTGLGASHALSLAVDASAQSTVYYTPFNDPIQRQRPYGLLGARAEFGPRHRRWAVNVYGRNLTDSDYIMAAFATSPAAYGGRPGAPRQAGVQLLWRH